MDIETPHTEELRETIGLLSSLLASCLADGSEHSEYDLIRWLQAPEQAIFREDALADTTTMFRTHFLVMHCLYRLRNEWLENGRGFLSITALRIVLLPPDQRGGQEISEQDPLADYYLDLNELSTSEEDIDQLLNDFWKRMVIPESYDDDLACLGLSAPADKQSIRMQYRRLAMEHHPDRGGNHEKFREITAAYQRLRNHA